MTVAQRADEHVRASVIIVNYDSWSYLQACLASVQAGLTEHDEVIVVDNDPRRELRALLHYYFPRVRVVENAANTGFGGGNNRGARQARGEYLAFLNPDTTVEPAWLDKLIKPLEADRSIGLATAKILLLRDPQHINTCGNRLHISGLTLCRGLGQTRLAFSCPEDIVAISGAAFVIRSDLYRALGGFDESFFMYLEDTDLSWRARLLGYRSVYVPESIVYHDYELRFGPAKAFYQERNRYMMLLKNWRWPTLILLLPTLLVAELVTWGFVLLRDRRQAGNKVRAYLWIIRHWRAIRAQRQRVQATRRVADRDLIRTLHHQLEFEQTTGPGLARAAHWIFDPIFGALHGLLKLAVVW